MSDMYLFDSTGRILKQWWWCDNCQVHFRHYIELCPACKQVAAPKGTKQPEDKTLVKFEGYWMRLVHSQDYYAAWCFESIRRIA